jgi:energy-coupling factor transporter ATP-binding protein EcfA2
MSGGQLSVESSGAGVDDTMVQLFTAGENPAFFYFAAQRFNVASTGFSVDKRLRADATNLPSVLAYLRGNYPDIYQEIVERVREIVPAVGAITISTEENNFKILLWPRVGPNERALAFDLAHSGTGVSQVLAILTAVVTSGPSVIVIDEINSYLHPAATKQLLQILTTFYSQHQYIVSTHSPDVMSFPNIDRMLMVEKSNFASSVRTINRNDLSEIRGAFRQLGIGMTDVLGADRVVWVEGPTEELVFPDLLRRAAIETNGSVRFAAVAATGDFAKRGSSRKAVIRLYSAATSAAAPLLEGSSFVLDRETLSDEAVQSIGRQTGKRLVFLRRRCLECYALNPAAIAGLITSEASDLSVDAATIEQEISRLGGDRNYGAASKWNKSLTHGSWLKSVDAAKLLADVFSNITENRLAFQKTIHTPRLIADTPIEDLKELVTTVKQALTAAGALN